MDHCELARAVEEHGGSLPSIDPPRLCVHSRHPPKICSAKSANCKLQIELITPHTSTCTFSLYFCTTGTTAENMISSLAWAALRMISTSYLQDLKARRAGRGRDCCCCSASAVEWRGLRLSGPREITPAAVAGHGLTHGP